MSHNQLYMDGMFFSWDSRVMKRRKHEPDPHAQFAIPMEPGFGLFGTPTEVTVAYTIDQLRQARTSCTSLWMGVSFQSDDKKRRRIQFKVQLCKGERNVLGVPGEQNILFRHGVTVYNSMVGVHLCELKGAQPQEPLTVGVRSTRWEWSAIDPETGETLENGSIKINVHVLVDYPTFPWTTSNVYGETKLGHSLLWYSALDISCRLAEGAKTKEEAVKKIAKALYSKGCFQYSPNSHFVKRFHENHRHNIQPDVSHDAQDGTDEAGIQDLGAEVGPIDNQNYFALRELLNDIYQCDARPSRSSPIRVNCADSAFLLISLANALGCHLTSGRLQGTANMAAGSTGYAMMNRFKTNKVCLVGTCPTEGQLLYHTVAWAGAGGEKPTSVNQFIEEPGVHIYDWSLGFFTRGTYLPQSGKPFNNEDNTPSQDTYKGLLARSEGWNRCIPQPVTVKRMSVF